MNWVKGAEVYLFCTPGNRANPGPREKSYHINLTYSYVRLM